MISVQVECITQLDLSTILPVSFDSRIPRTNEIIDATRVLLGGCTSPSDKAKRDSSFNFFTFKLVTCVNFKYPIKPFFQTSAANESLRKELFSIVTSGPNLIWFSLKGVSNGKDFQVGCIRVLHQSVCNNYPTQAISHKNVNSATQEKQILNKSVIHPMLPDSSWPCTKYPREH